MELGSKVSRELSTANRAQNWKKNMFDRLTALLRRRRSSASAADVKAFREAISINTDSSEFQDLYPTYSEVRDAIVSTGVIRSEEIEWVATTIAEKVRDGAGFDTAIQAVSRAGELANPNQLKELKINPRRKIGVRFLSAISGPEVTACISALEDAVWTCTSSANQLHNLRRAREGGITHCRLMSAGDERTTPLERKYDGRRITIDAAVSLVKKHGRDIRRSVFQSEIKF